MFTFFWLLFYSRAWTLGTPSSADLFGTLINICLIIRCSVLRLSFVIRNYYSTEVEHKGSRHQALPKKPQVVSRCMPEHFTLNRHSSRKLLLPKHWWSLEAQRQASRASKKTSEDKTVPKGKKKKTKRRPSYVTIYRQHFLRILIK